jgi:hypothetical protein
VTELAQRIRQRLERGPLEFYDLLRELSEVEYPDILAAWGELREQLPLERDEQGRHLPPAADKL